MSLNDWIPVGALYVALGYAAGTLGEWIFVRDLNPWVQRLELLAQVGMASLFLFMAFQIYHSRTPGISFMSHAGLSKLGFSKFLNSKYNGAAMGVFTVLLPCGWLHAFVLSALATENAWKGSVKAIRARLIHQKASNY